MIKAYAKINLELKVIKKLDNGFHQLKMLNAKINLYDKIYIKKSKENTIKYSNFKIEQKSDTLLKIIEEIQKRYTSIPKLYIYIKKRIPVGGGLGGMSSDAAYILKYLNKKFNLQLALKEMVDFLLPFGKDMCYALYETPCIVEGMGEIIRKYNGEVPSEIIMINPHIKTSTKDIFNLHDQINPDEINLEIFKNDLEYSFRKLYKDMNKLFNELIDLNIGKVQLTGSGSCILIFNNDKKNLKKLKRKYKNFDINIYKIRKE